jgi:hypothetical protein
MKEGFGNIKEADKPKLKELNKTMKALKKAAFKQKDTVRVSVDPRGYIGGKLEKKEDLEAAETISFDEKALKSLNTRLQTLANAIVADAVTQAKTTGKKEIGKDEVNAAFDNATRNKVMAQVQELADEREKARDSILKKAQKFGIKITVA